MFKWIKVYFDREDFKLFKHQDAEESQDNQTLTYESVILLNIKDSSTEDRTQQLSARSYIADACYTLNVGSEEFSELSRLRVIPQLSYEHQDKLESALAHSGIDQDTLSQLYDAFYQEGKSNIQNQKDTSGKTVNVDEKVQLYHEATQRYLWAIPINDSTSSLGSFRLGFSKRCNNLTHFRFVQVSSDTSDIKSNDNIFLQLEVDAAKYTLNSTDEGFYFKTDKQQPMTLVKLTNDFGCRDNAVQQRCKYVYIRHGDSNNFLVPIFDNNFTQHKLYHIGLRQIDETSALELEFIWKLILLSEGRTAFIHCQSGIFLNFDENFDWTETTGLNGRNRQAHVSTMIEDTGKSLKISPVDSDISLFDTLTSGGKFSLQNSEDDTIFYVKSCQKDNVEVAEEEKSDEIKYTSAPQIQNQECYREVFGNQDHANTRFNLDSTIEASEAASFSVACVEEGLKKEIEFGHSLTETFITYFDNKIRPISNDSNDGYKQIELDENIKFLKTIQDYIINNLSDFHKPQYNVGKFNRHR